MTGFIFIRTMTPSFSGEHQHEVDLLGSGGAQRVRPLAAERLRGGWQRVRPRRRDRGRQVEGRAGRRQAQAQGQEVHSDASHEQGQRPLWSLQHYVSY